MSKRHKDAIAISDGACNPRAIVRAMLAATEELAGHDVILADPALKLMTHQLAYLQGIPTSVDLEDYKAWREVCEKEQA